MGSGYVLVLPGGAQGPAATEAQKSACQLRREVVKTKRRIDAAEKELVQLRQTLAEAEAKLKALEKQSEPK
jgi:uncharacterized coiled-coil DUF342 family protein